MSNRTRIILPNYHSVWLFCATALFTLLSGCGARHIPEPSAGHLDSDSLAAPPAVANRDIPPLVTEAPVLPKPSAQQKLDTYTVIVNEVPIRELLFALARDAKLNLDIYDNITGNITINAIDQTLPQILERIAKQNDIRYQVNGNNLVVSADTPFLRTYQVPYVNMRRSSQGQIDISTQIAASGTGNIGGGGRSRGSNNSILSVVNSSDNNFWESLFVNVAAIVGDKPRINSKPENLVSNRVVVNRESGLMTVRATGKQHAEIQTFVDTLVSSAQRQVLIEATVVEVTLSNSYQAGVDWSRVATNASDGVSVVQSLIGSDLSNPPTFVLDAADPRGDYNITASVRLLEQYGDVKVLSSPKIMALNNQASMLKVVDNRVYFTIEVDVSQNENNTLTVFESQVHTVPVGLVMGLVPYISEDDEIILNIRPTISRILSFLNDPNPALADAGVVSPIPEIQVREMESVLRLNSGQVAMIGGLMQDSVDKDTDAIPAVSRIPGVGEAFKKRSDQFRKSELVIFLRTTVIREPNIDSEMRQFKQFLPGARISAKPGQQ